MLDARGPRPGRTVAIGTRSWEEADQRSCPWAESVDAVVASRQSSASVGLGRDEARARLSAHGPNALAVDPGPGRLRILVGQFRRPLVSVLLAAVGIAALLREWVDAAVIGAVVVVNAIIGFVEEARARIALDALARTMRFVAVVVRDGEEHEIDASDLVPGDIVLLRAGDRVPADLRVIEARSLRVDESSLTGEAVPTGKSVDPVPEDTILADRRSMAYASTLVTFGRATGIVVATGGDTEVGRLALLIARVGEPETPLTRDLRRTARRVIGVTVVLAALTFASGVAGGTARSEAFLAAVALTVAAVPEGLPAVVTIVQAIGVTRMARRRAIVRSLAAVETLGSTTVICSDKTGTLTENQMTVVHLAGGGRVLGVSGSGYEPEGTVDGPMENEGIAETLRCGVLCNDSRWLEHDDGTWRILGDPTEGALIVAAHKGKMPSERERGRFRRLDTIPFDSEAGFMATLHEDSAGRSVVYLKGSVEAVLERCATSIDADGRIVPLDRAAIGRTAEALAGEGERVLAFARRFPETRMTELEHSDTAAGMTFLGLQAMIDPPRPGVADAVEACRNAGISVRMVTGDHPATARAVAVSTRIISRRSGSPVVTGADLAGLDDRQFEEAAQQAAVFARVAPDQKLRLVEALQRGGEVVTMTGDGVNDAPALKRADVGVAMGANGTDAARDVSDVVLADDNFVSIAAAVEEGRGTYDNLVKFVAWTLPTNLGEALIVLVGISVGGVLPIAPVQILWVNMTTALMLGLMLAFEPREPGIMTRPPRRPGAPLISRAIAVRIVAVGLLLLAAAYGLFSWERSLGAGEDEARTVAVTTFVAVEAAYLFNCRSLSRPIRELGWFSNRWVWMGTGAMILAQVAFVYVPGFQRIFGTAPIGPDAWLRIVGAALVVSALIAMTEAARRRSAVPSGSRPAASPL